ncbi:MAG: 2-amino-4-hydroxy-6-hydroxymethyldihydropteridine diphosphokinase [Bryobacterales bacterium]|nr:2-amino-4-hydroxy-6-hydroxymethyldihydropteridine diphosphokinase [Bryobacterales bacterium]
MKLVYIGLGSNMGDRELLLRHALEKLEEPDIHLLRTSSLYETEPIGLQEQAWFLNLVAEFETTLFPRQLLHRAQRVERELGRKRSVVNGPRTLDIDILLYGQTVMESDELTIPHPRYAERRFVLAPLAELDPKLRDPLTGRTVTEMLNALQGQAVQRRGRL